MAGRCRRGKREEKQCQGDWGISSLLVTRQKVQGRVGAHDTAGGCTRLGGRVGTRAPSDKGIHTKLGCSRGWTRSAAASGRQLERSTACLAAQQPTPPPPAAQALTWPMLARMRFQVLPRGSTRRGAWITVRIGR